MSVSLRDRIKSRAYALGFDLVGIAPAQPSPHAAEFTAWLEAGYAGTMAYMAREPERRQDPRNVLNGARSVVSVGLSYYTLRLPDDILNDPSRGIISNYAWGADYHDLMLPRLKALAEFIQAEAGCAVATKAYVDTGPLLERDVAVQAGLGFTGKNTCLIQPRLGSYLFLGEVLVSVEIEPDPLPSSSVGCGRCTRCLVACPTEAFVSPYVLDSRRCISYLTIELRGPIPRELRPLMRNRIFGCDICQEVCPFNQPRPHAPLRAAPTNEPRFAPREATLAPKLVDLLRMSEEEFRTAFRNSPVKRAKWRGFRRNVAVALGNSRDPDALPVLQQELERESDPVVREHLQWAIHRLL